MRKLSYLSPVQVVELQDALLANADRLLTSALAIVDLGYVGLARSVAILALEETGKAIAIHERRVQMAFAPEGDPFVDADLAELWTSHRKKLERVHRFLTEEPYWFGVEPPDPERSEAHLGTIKAWAQRHDRFKQQGFYVETSKSGDVMAPMDVGDGESLTDVIRHVHQIGWQLRLGEHIEGQQQDQREQGSPPVGEEMMERLERPESRVPGWLRNALQEGVPGERLNNIAYRFNPPDADLTPFRNFGRPGYEAETRELLRLADEFEEREHH